MNYPLGLVWLCASFRPGQCFSDPENQHPELMELPETVRLWLSHKSLLSPDPGNCSGTFRGSSLRIPTKA